MNRAGPAMVVAVPTAMILGSGVATGSPISSSDSGIPGARTGSGGMETRLCQELQPAAEGPGRRRSVSGQGREERRVQHGLGLVRGWQDLRGSQHLARRFVLSRLLYDRYSPHELLRRNGEQRGRASLQSVMAVIAG